jgi:hypothetical protein
LNSTAALDAVISNLDPLSPAEQIGVAVAALALTVRANDVSREKALALFADALDEMDGQFGPLGGSR